jgi:hypothetical protein
VERVVTDVLFRASVMVNGRVVGGASVKLCKSIASKLRSLKVQEKPTVPPTLEVAYIPPGKTRITHVMSCSTRW